MDESSATLFRRLKEAPDDEHRWRALVEHYRPWVYHWVRSRLGRDDAAEDLTSDLFFKIFLHLGTLNPAAGGIRPWISTVVYNSMQSWVRDERRRFPAVTDDQLRGLGSEAAVRDLEFQLDLAEYRDRFLAAERILLSQTKLQPETYAAFLLIVRDGLTAAEAAARLGSTAGSATKNKNRVAKALLKEMDLPDRPESLAILAQVVGTPPVPAPPGVTPAPSV